MRFIGVTVFFSLLLLQAQAQTSTPYLPANYPSTGMPVNYVRTWEALKPESNTGNITTASVIKDFRMTTQYLDGLGRPIQTVTKKGSWPTGLPGKDMIGTNIYDDFGRETYKYLPAPATGAGGNTSVDDGMFKRNPFEQQAYALSNSFVLSPIIGQGENYLYGMTKFEASPLNRVTETFAPGNSWMGTADETLESNRRSVKIKYYTNTATDAVRIWTVTDPVSLGNWGTYATSATYPAGELYKTITIDEQNKQVIEFKDKQGQVILKKVQIGGTGDDGTGADHGNNWLCTYYIYDDLGRLRCVIQPQGVRQINSSWLPNAATLNEHCFRYEYDERSRMIMKRLPGVALGEVYMVYDARDRLVMMQDGNMRVNNKWMVNKYDSLNRPVETGRWTSYTVFSLHLTNAKPSTSYPITTSGYDQLTVTHYDDYTSLPGGLTTTLDNTGSSELYTSYNTSPVYAQALTVSTQTVGMVTWTATRVLETPDFIYSVNLYDGKGRLIQTKTKNNTGGTDIFTTQYNWAGQPIKTVNKTEKAGTNAQTITVVNRMSYDDLARLYKVEKKIAHSGINSGALSADWITILEQSYDAIGQVNKKTIGNKKDPATNAYYSTRHPLQELVYDHNIRGWLLGTNRDYLTSNDQTTDGKLFGFELGYDNLTSKAGNNFSAAQYNGNIGGMTWKSDGDDTRRRYDFSYDAANRLLKAEFKQNNTGSTWNKTLVDFTVQMGNSGADDGTAYDANGNIQKMKQWGLKLTGPTQIDNLTYTYHAGGNRLKAVTESGTGTTDHKLGDFTDKNTSATDYGYDRNGNLVIDLNKQLKGTVAPNTDMLSGGAILYNHLNLPYQITVRNDAGTADKGTISYVYDATGVKLQKITTENSVSVTFSGTAYTTNITTTTTYLNGVVFESKQYSDAGVNMGLGYTDRLQFFGQEEGRIRAVNDPANPNTLTGLEYDYLIKDHLGNVRMVLTEQVKQDEYPAATMETAQAATENMFYNNLEATRVNRPSGYTDTYTDPNDKVALVRGDGNKIGPAILLKVMAGDRFNVKASAWWTGSSSGSNTSPLTSIVSALISSAPGVSGGKIGVTELTSTLLDPQVSLFLDNDQPAVSGKPKAYLNWILFDEQFNYVDNGNSGAEPVEASGVVKPFNKTDMPVDRNGYLYIYTSNETSYDVFFDNLQVTHIRGPLLEETHYYPFGLTMAGISSKALEFGGVENKYKFNSGTELSSKEFSDGSGLDWYESFFRGYNPQIGRFHQIDPLGEIAENWTPYAFCNNNPLRYTDPLGLFSVDPEGPKETSTAEKPKELGGVTVVGFKNHPAPPPSGLNTGSPAASGVDARVTPLPVVNPSPTPAPNPVTTPTTTPSPSPGGGVAPVLGRIGGTILAVVTPTYGGLASGDLNPYQMPKPLVNPLPNPNPWTGHGNSRRNTNPHIVYEYSFIPTDDETPILKYGISDEYRYGMGRPQSQLAGLRALYGPTVTLRIITRTLNRDQALKIEQKLVDVHQINYRQMPREQYRPLPTAR